MTQQRDIERVLDRWFSDGPSQAPDRVVDIVGDRIERQSQRPAWRLHWRPTTVNAYAKIAVAAAAVLLVAVIGYNLLPGRSTGVGAPAPSATSQPSVTPSSTPIVSPRAVTDGPLSAGRYRIRPVDSVPSLSVVADVPAGWLALGQFYLENVLATNSGPSGIAIVFATPSQGLFTDPCHWDLNGNGKLDEDGNVTVGPAVADLVGALRANHSFTASAPNPVAFGAYSGQQLTLTFPAGLDPATCDRDTTNDSGTYRVMPDTIYAQGTGNIWDLSIVDVAGTRVVVIIEHFPGTDPRTLAEADAIVDSLEFTP